MGKLGTAMGEFEYRWASAVAFNGVRLEVLSVDSDVWFDVSLPSEGELAIRTFGKVVPPDVVLAAIATAGRR